MVFHVRFEVVFVVCSYLDCFLRSLVHPSSFDGGNSVMAIRKQGRYFHAYFVQWERDGTELRRRQVQRCLYTDDKLVARSLERRLMQEARINSEEAKAGAKIEAIVTGTPVKSVLSVPRRVKIANAIPRAEKYATIGATALRHWKRFEREIHLVYLDEVTPERALNYLERIGAEGKNFNNIRSSLNGIFKLLLIDANLPESPFERIHTRKASTISQRPFTFEEYRRILEVAPSPWFEAVQIAWYTGLREKDVFSLKWSEIHGDLIQRLPAKTARYRREVVIPIHPKLDAVLRKIPRNGERVLGNWKYNPQYIGFRRAFSEILKKAGIQSDEHGKVCFNSFRNSFVTRCDAAGIPRHAIRGVVGHVSDSMTDLYSHDTQTARLIQSLPDAL